MPSPYTLTSPHGPRRAPAARSARASRRVAPAPLRLLGAKRYARHIPAPPSRLPPVGPWLAVARRCLRPAAPPGSAGRSPSGPPPALWLRLSGRAAPALSGRSRPPPPSLRRVLRPPAARARSLRPGFAWSPSARCGLRPCFARAPWLPGGCLLRRGPLSRPGCARLCPRGSRRGAWAAAAARFGSGPPAWGDERNGGGACAPPPLVVSGERILVLVECHLFLEVFVVLLKGTEVFVHIHVMLQLIQLATGNVGAVVGDAL